MAFSITPKDKCGVQLASPQWLAATAIGRTRPAVAWQAISPVNHTAMTREQRAPMAGEIFRQPHRHDTRMKRAGGRFEMTRASSPAPDSGNQ
jgi:hypothetical protein